MERAVKAQQIVAAAVAVLAIGWGNTQPADAQSYPSQPIRIIVPASAGGPNDIAARLAAQILPPKLGQPVIVENRPGAGGALGAREVAKAAPDGYTLLAGGGAQLGVLPAISERAGYDPTKDFAAVAGFFDSFQILEVNPASPWRTVAELVAYAKANPGKLNYAHVGTGHITHLAGEMFMATTGTSLVGVPYRSGGESVTALLGQAVHLTFENSATSLPLVRQGKLRGLAVTTASRTALAPDLPTMIEAGVPGYEVTSFFGIVAPAGTPASVLHLLNTTIDASLETPEIQETIARLGAVPHVGPPEEFAATIAAQFEKWRAFGKAANIKID